MSLTEDELCSIAVDLAKFLIALQAINPTHGPIAGMHSFYRGGSLTIYDEQTRRALAQLEGNINVKVATEIWNTALASRWLGSPVWVHGDIKADNLLVQNKRLTAVIDFGQLAIGDPACDLAIAWTFFKGKSRDIFRQSLTLDENTWARGRAWALWKALIKLAGFIESTLDEIPQQEHIIGELLADHMGNS